MRTDPYWWCVLGPTAVGKSAVALELAERIGGEIISVDSMQMYRGLDIGTAKPSAEERQRVPHHLIEVADLGEEFDVAKFVQFANSAEAEIRARGRVPVFCGGTAFYLKALLSGIGAGPPADPELRARLEAAPLEELLNELAATDPLAFERIDRKNPRRIVRAVEVIRLTGRPFSEQKSHWTKAANKGGRLIALTREAGDLRQRIDARVDRMFADGLLEETRRMLAAGLAENRTAMQAIGYRQVVEHLRGERSQSETVALVKAKTWQFARRQQTWLRNRLDPAWIKLAAGSQPAAVAGELTRLAAPASDATDSL
jgi:tRNA dimethylallyltransferase